MYICAYIRNQTKTEMKHFHSRSLDNTLKLAQEIKEEGYDAVGYNTAIHLLNGRTLGLTSIVRIWRNNITFIATTPELADRFYAEIDQKQESPEVPATETSPTETAPAPVIIKKLKRVNNGQ